jgi:hypothetical protein
MPPNIEFTTFLSFFTTKGAPNCHFSQGKGAAKFFSVLKGAVNQKRLKNTGLDLLIRRDSQSIKSFEV